MTVELRVRRASGFALIAVLVTLSILMVMAVPFVLSMGHGASAAGVFADQKQAAYLSASIRDAALFGAAKGHPSVDQSPAVDGLAEFPREYELPAGLQGILKNGPDRHLLSAEIRDLQSRIDLNTASPLLLANLLGLAAKLTRDHQPDETELELDNASNLPDQGYVVVDRELIHYRGRDGAKLLDLERGLEQGLGFVDSAEHVLRVDSLVLDFRTVLAVCSSFYFRGGRSRGPWTPYASVNEIARIGEAGFGNFSPTELATLRASLTVGSIAENATAWGKPERIFEDVTAGEHVLRVRSATFLGGGSVVRIRSLDGAKSEYGLCWSTEVPRGYPGTVNLPSEWYVNLLLPVSQDFQGLNTVVEPLVRKPVNINTAPRRVLVALFLNVRAGRRANTAHIRGGLVSYVFSRSEAESLADEIITLRGDGEVAGGEAESHPFADMEDLVRRFLEPHLISQGQVEKHRYRLLAQNLATGRDGEVRMGTAPVCFASAPVVAYRAAAAVLRPSGVLGAREERSGIASVMPGRTLDLVLATQSAFDEAIRLDRRAPYYLTLPINTAPLSPFDRGTFPPSRTLAQILPIAFPQAGFGHARFASHDANGAGFRPMPSSTPFFFPRTQPYSYESMWSSLDPEGMDVGKEGPYEMPNNGPRGRGAQAPAPQGGGHDRVPFPFTEADGLVARHAVGFWFKLDGTGDQALFDLSADDELRNRISLQIREGELVLEVIDEAGIDPAVDEIRAAGTSPERTAGTWKVPLTDVSLEAGVWTHASLSAEGNRPDQITLLLDNVPRGKPELRTFLSAPIPEYQRPTGLSSFRDDKERFLTIRVEDTEGFPERGVLRIGLELFEYSSKDANSFNCQFVDSLGGRVARMALREYRPRIPVDNLGRPTVDLNRLTGGTNLDIAPPHSVGAEVELYGYALPLYRDSVILAGSARLQGQIGPFAVARIINKNAKAIDLPLRRGSVTLGVGLQDNETVDLELGDPLAVDKYPPAPASKQIAEAFSTSGGYALLMQRPITFQSANLGGGTVAVGGIELIRYGARNGSKLTGVRRGLTLPPLQSQGQSRDFDGTSRKFVTQWNQAIRISVGRGRGFEVRKLPQYLAYLVPISLPVVGNVIDPTTIGRSEWVQLFSQGGDESDTEWVRYDYVTEGFLMRTNLRSWQGVLAQLTRNLGNRALTGIMQRLGGDIVDPDLVSENVYPRVRQDGVGYIGYIDRVEVEYPQINLARRFLQFRGDPFTRTTSHAQGANTLVLQCHRMELDWGNYGALAGRCGRDDRVALVGGSQADGSSRPPVEWHTVNWTAQRYGTDVRSGGGGGGARRNRNAELLGSFPFQLVAFKDPVQQAFIGPENRDPFRDTRLIDRLVKFPSGELPAASPESGMFGASTERDAPPATGVFDELNAVRHVADQVILDEEMPETAQELVARDDLFVNALGATGTNQSMTRLFPPQGGLIMVDGEIMAYQSVADGRFQIATNGRALLGTQARGHDEGAPVHFLSQIPTAILSNGVSENSHQLLVRSLGNLPRHGGTVFLNGELLHYSWTVGDQMLEMPEWFDPEREETEGRGLLRGRYGTNPASGSAGEPVIFFPCRYWDRHRDRADDPELAYFQITTNQTPVFFRGIYWEEEQIDELVDVQCLVRIDSQGSFADDPKKNPALFLLRDGDVDHHPVPLGRQGSRLEARFFTIYRPGAFDPVEFRAQAWKKAEAVRTVLISFEGEGRILSERVTAR